MNPARIRGRTVRSFRSKNRGGCNRPARVHRPRRRAFARSKPPQDGSPRRLLPARCARVVRLQFDARLGSERANRLTEIEVFRFLHERDDVAAGSAPEALEESAVGMDVKRRRLLGVKGAQPDQIVAALFERYVASDEGGNIDASSDFAQSALIVLHVSFKTSSPGRRFPRRGYAKPLAQ